MNFNQISIPAISSGIYGMPLRLCVRLFAKAIRRSIDSDPQFFDGKEIILCNIDDKTTNAFLNDFEQDLTTTDKEESDEEFEEIKRETKERKEKKERKQKKRKKYSDDKDSEDDEESMPTPRNHKKLKKDKKRKKDKGKGKEKTRTQCSDSDDY